jgi:hypothetical protein
MVVDAGEAVSKLSGLKRREAFVGNPDEITKLDWLKDWSESA